MPLLLPFPIPGKRDEEVAVASSSPLFHSSHICGLLQQLQCWARPNAPTQTTVTHSRAARVSQHTGPPLGVVGETQACFGRRHHGSGWVLPRAPAAVCSRFPGELPHCLETALLGNNWRWGLPEDLGHLRLLAAAWLYISSQHHIARPQCSLFPASKLYEKAAKNTLNTFLMFPFHVSNCCGRKWLVHFCLVEVVHWESV